MIIRHFYPYQTALTPNGHHVGQHSPAPDNLARNLSLHGVCDIDAINACDINGCGDGIANPSRLTPRFGRGAVTKAR